MTPPTGVPTTRIEGLLRTTATLASTGMLALCRSLRDLSTMTLQSTRATLSGPCGDGAASPLLLLVNEAVRQVKRPLACAPTRLCFFFLDHSLSFLSPILPHPHLAVPPLAFAPLYFCHSLLFLVLRKRSGVVFSAARGKRHFPQPNTMFFQYFPPDAHLCLFCGARTFHFLQLLHTRIALCRTAMEHILTNFYCFLHTENRVGYQKHLSYNLCANRAHTGYELELTGDMFRRVHLDPWHSLEHFDPQSLPGLHAVRLMDAAIKNHDAENCEACTMRKHLRKGGAPHFIRLTNARLWTLRCDDSCNVSGRCQVREKQETRRLVYVNDATHQVLCLG